MTQILRSDLDQAMADLYAIEDELEVAERDGNSQEVRVLRFELDVLQAEIQIQHSQRIPRCPTDAQLDDDIPF